MKVLIVLGGKSNGNTAKLAKQFAKGAEAAGHEVEVVDAFKADIHGCIDCQACKRNGGTCVFKDDMPALNEKVIAADVLLFASPVYYFSISAQLKAFMDRTYAVIERIRDKRLYLITTAEGPSDTFAADLEKVAVPVEGWADCFEGMAFEKHIHLWDMGTTPDITQAPEYAEAERIGASI